MRVYWWGGGGVSEGPLEAVSGGGGVRVHLWPVGRREGPLEAVWWEGVIVHWRLCLAHGNQWLSVAISPASVENDLLWCVD